jgi:hypothetical protein
MSLFDRSLFRSAHSALPEYYPEPSQRSAEKEGL